MVPAKTVNIIKYKIKEFTILSIETLAYIVRVKFAGGVDVAIRKGDGSTLGFCDLTDRVGTGGTLVVGTAGTREPTTALGSWIRVGFSQN